MTAVARFFYAATCVFNTETRAQLLYGIPIWISTYIVEVEKIQSTFLCCLLGVPKCVGYAALHLEIGVGRLETSAWIQTLKFWLRIHFLAEHCNYVYHMLPDSYIICGYL